eukprot:5002831-Amphidinium_carterae.1
MGVPAPLKVTSRTRPPGYKDSVGGVSASSVQEDLIQQLTTKANKVKEVEMVVKDVRAAMVQHSGPSLVKYVMNIDYSSVGHKVTFGGRGVPLDSRVMEDAVWLAIWHWWALCDSYRCGQCAEVVPALWGS